MNKLLIVAPVAALARSDYTCPGSPAPLHAWEEQTVTIEQLTCAEWLDEVRARVAGQATGDWHDPHNNGVYTITDDKVDAHEMHLQRLTGNKKYTDKMIFAYEDSSAGCEIKACSESQVTSVYDFSGNFCNLRMMLCSYLEGCVSVKHRFTMYSTENKRSAGATSKESDCMKVFASAQGLATVEDNKGQFPFEKYPGYTGDLQVTGTATVGLGKVFGEVGLSWNIQGLEADKCKVPPEGVANACGIHIHVGNSCDDADVVGGHYYDTESFPHDPWAPIVYTPTASGKSKGSTSLNIGQGLSQVVGRAVVVHDHTGGRVACGLIPGGALEDALMV